MAALNNSGAGGGTTSTGVSSLTNLGGWLGMTPQSATYAVPYQQIALDPETLRQQQNFVTALQGQYEGAGPSVASTMLKNQSDANNRQMIGQAVGARGVNSGLALKNAMQQGGINQQQANQTAASARAQEQMNAGSLLGNQLNTIQQQGLNAAGANQNTQLGAQQIALKGTEANAGRTQQMIGAGLSAAGTGLSALSSMGGGSDIPDGLSASDGMAHGGLVQRRMADGGAVEDYGGGDTWAPSTLGAPQASVAPTPTTMPGPQSAVGQYLTGGDSESKGGGGISFGDVAKGVAAVAPYVAMAFAAKGGQAGSRVQAMVSPGERYLPPAVVQQVASGRKDPMKAGEKIQGTPKVGGAKDSYANDTVPKTLESGGIVLPRHVTQGKDAPEKAAEFVRAILARKGLK